MQMNEYPKISVVIITYNQEKVIGRALDSILVQSDWGLKDIIVCDDCSKDATWDVLMEYARKYPKYIRAYRNSSNMGIYGNMQHALTYLEDTDLVYFCSGDDAFCDGLFRGGINVIAKNNIDLKSDYAIYCDWKSISPDGKEYVFRNNLIEMPHCNPCSLKLRGLICNRSCAASFSVIKKFKTVPVERGVSVAEFLFDIQHAMLADKNYYFQFIGSIYYSGVGVSAQMGNVKDWINMREAYEEYNKMDVFSESDKRYISYMISYYSFLITNKTFYLLKTWWYYFVSIKYQFSFKRTFLMMGSMIKRKLS